MRNPCRGALKRKRSDEDRVAAGAISKPIEGCEFQIIFKIHWFLSRDEIQVLAATSKAGVAKGAKDLRPALCPPLSRSNPRSRGIRY